MLAPLNDSGDREGARLENGVVRTPAGFCDAYNTFVAGGWGGLSCPEDYGGQGLPLAVSAAVSEMWSAANLGFALCPMLTVGAVEALEHHGSEELKARVPAAPGLRRMDRDDEPDRAAGRFGRGRAEDAGGEGGDHYRITGQKIFITYGDHDLAENIIHLVLARTPDSPPARGAFRCFWCQSSCPMQMAHSARNDVRCVALEHKLGIHASPTAVSRSATRRARSASSSARNIVAWSACSP